MSFTDPKSKGAIQVGRTNGFVALPAGTDGDFLTADSGASSGTSYQPSSTSSVASIWPFLSLKFGTGALGSLTLGGNTVLAPGDYVANYIDLDLNGSALTSDPSDPGIVIFVQGTLSTGTIGVIKAADLDTDSGSPSQNGTGGPGGTGQNIAGGDGGQPVGYVFVFADTITGSGSILANGRNGSAGTDGQAVSTDQGRSFGGTGEDFTHSAWVHGIQWPQTSSNVTGHAGNAPGDSFVGGAGGASEPGIIDGGAGGAFPVNLVFLADIQGILFHANPQTFGLTVPNKGNQGYGRGWGAGTGGGGGGAANNPIAGPGIGEASGEAGGGGGGGGAYVGTGGAGGAGGIGDGISVGPTIGATGGGAGGGGASGSFVLVCGKSVSNITVSANGGVGGDGGDGGVGDVNGGAGGGGGGGGGGIAIVIAQSGWSGSIGVGGGAGGNKSIVGNSSSDGQAGTAGLSQVLAWDV